MVILDGSQLKQHTQPSTTFPWPFLLPSLIFLQDAEAPFPPSGIVPKQKTNYRLLRLLNELRMEDPRLSLTACSSFFLCEFRSLSPTRGCVSTGEHDSVGNLYLPREGLCWRPPVCSADLLMNDTGQWGSH